MSSKLNWVARGTNNFRDKGLGLGSKAGAPIFNRFLLISFIWGTTYIYYGLALLISSIFCIYSFITLFGS